jgi:hypothetical protein
MDISFALTFIDNTIFSPLGIIGGLVENYFTACDWIYFWVFCSIPLVFVSVFMLVSYCFGYYSFAI